MNQSIVTKSIVSRALLILFLILVGFLGGCVSKDKLSQPMPLTSFRQTASLQKLWQRSVGNGSGHHYLYLSPVVDQGVIFVPSYDGTIIAFNKTHGNPLWQYHYPYHFTTGIAAGHHLLFIVNHAGYLLALRQSDGKLLWSVDIKSSVLAAPVVANGIVLVHGVNGTLTAYKVDNGQMLWQVKQSVPDLMLYVAARPLVWQKYVICGFANGRVIAFKLKNGEEVWSTMVATAHGVTNVERMVDVSITPLVVGNTLFVVSYQGRLLALNIKNGTIYWQHKLSAYAGMAVDNHYVYVVANNSYIWAFNKKTGAIIWRNTKLANRGVSGPAIVDRYLAVADYQGFIHFLSLVDGRFIARGRINLTSIIMPAIVDQQTIYFYTVAGQLLACRIKS